MRRVGARQLAAKGAIVATALACIATEDLDTGPWQEETNTELEKVELTESEPEATVTFRVESSRPPLIRVRFTTSLIRDDANVLSATLSVTGGNDASGLSRTWPTTDEEQSSAEQSGLSLALGTSAGEDTPFWGSPARPDCYRCVNEVSVTFRLTPTEAVTSAIVSPSVLALVGGGDYPHGTPPRAYVRVVAE